jgi:hypothetical protein
MIRKQKNYYYKTNLTTPVSRLVPSANRTDYNLLKLINQLKLQSHVSICDEELSTPLPCSSHRKSYSLEELLCTPLYSEVLN